MPCMPIIHSDLKSRVFWQHLAIFELKGYEYLKEIVSINSSENSSGYSQIIRIFQQNIMFSSKKKSDIT